MRARLAAIITIAALSQSLAADRYMILGAGAVSCGRWVSDIEQRPNMMSWILGFLSGYNVVIVGESSNISEGIDAVALERWITNYCRENPLSILANATVELVVELGTGQKLQSN